MTEALKEELKHWFKRLEMDEANMDGRYRKGRELHSNRAPYIIRHAKHGPCKNRAKTVQMAYKRKIPRGIVRFLVDFGALEGTRIPGPLIKRIQGASFVKFQKFEETLFLSYHRETRLCIHRIICIQWNALQLLSSHSGVQKCADGQNKAQWTNQSPVLWQGLGHPNRHRFT